MCEIDREREWVGGGGAGAGADLDLRLGGDLPGEEEPEQALEYSRVLEKNAERERGVWSRREGDLDLRLGGDLPGEEEPEQALGERLLPTLLHTQIPRSAFGPSLLFLRYYSQA